MTSKATTIKRRTLEALMRMLIPPIRNYICEELDRRDARIAQLEQLSLDELSELQRRIENLEQKP